MKAVLGLLFPLRRTFDKLGLEQRWWHRLAVVSFFIAVTVTLAGSWFIGFAALEPNPSSMPDVQYVALGTDGNWHAITLGPPVTQEQYDEALKQKKGGRPPLAVGVQTLIAVQDGAALDYKTAPKGRIQMPDGTARDFPAPKEGEIATAWKKALHKAIFKEWVLSIGAAVLLTLALSYLLQSLYRALLYVIYGSKKDSGQTQTGERPDLA